LECSNQEVGFTTNFIDLNLIFYCLEELKELILRPDYLQLDSCPQQMHSATEKNDFNHATYQILNYIFTTVVKVIITEHNKYIIHINTYTHHSYMDLKH
jgi:hypothetical protein